MLLPLLAAVLAAARDKPENWTEVRSPHFTVVTNSNEKQGRRVADQFERMRSVFHVAFPKLQIDPGSPIVVLAIKDEKDFKALEPEAYLAKGSLKLGGLFLRAADKNYVLMRLDAEGEHPYSVVYHEYTHLLMSKTAEWMPLWLNEGLAEFYQTTEIHEKDVSLGEPSAENIQLLRQNRLLPFATLFTVDEKSPYYHEENKGSIFLRGVVGAGSLHPDQRSSRPDDPPEPVCGTSQAEGRSGNGRHPRVRGFKATAIGSGRLHSARHLQLFQDDDKHGGR
ncbi:MAG: hypothetical protein WCA27_20485 [Candidatus Sulfotelmatobacter sp.]